jgi:hypothetical protein
MEHRWHETDVKKPTYSGKTCASATLSTTNPTWTDPGSNPGVRGERPATNRLSHGTAYIISLKINFIDTNLAVTELRTGLTSVTVGRGSSGYEKLF